MVGVIDRSGLTGQLVHLDYYTLPLLGLAFSLECCLVLSARLLELVDAGFWGRKWLDGFCLGFEFVKSHQVFSSATVTVGFHDSHSAPAHLLDKAFAQLDARSFDLRVKFASFHSSLDQFKCGHQVFC